MEMYMFYLKQISRYNIIFPYNKDYNYKNITKSYIFHNTRKTITNNNTYNLIHTVLIIHINNTIIKYKLQ